MFLNNVFEVVFKYVSSSPAQLAVFESSAVALLRTATKGELSILYAIKISCRKLRGNGASRKSTRITFEIRSTELISLWLISFSCASMSSLMAVSSMNRSNTCAVTTNPGGTDSPARINSPKLAPLPPASPTSFFAIADKGMIQSLFCLKLISYYLIIFRCQPLQNACLFHLSFLINASMFLESIQKECAVSYAAYNLQS